MEPLSLQLLNAATIHEKIAVLDACESVSSFLEKPSSLRTILMGLTPEYQFAMKQLLAIGQMERILASGPLNAASIENLIGHLHEIEVFYREIGGIAGYQEKIQHLLVHSASKDASPSAIYHSPSFIDITTDAADAISWGIDAVPQMAEIYPLGGAADRLHLIDEATGSELPAAKLKFAGRTLFEGLIRDLEAREYLHYLRTKKQETTPIAIMTSHEKDNHRHVYEICEENRWFGRPKEMFRLFTQPLVPVVNQKGEWCLSGPMTPLLKPGGHGALWKRAKDEGIFAWFESLGRKKALVRQINNPAACLDHGLLAFTGIGWKKGMKFGFASCPRLLKAAEGVNVLIEREERGRKSVVLTNVEYCDFGKMGIEDAPLKEGEPYSRFSSNTNILFADLAAVQEAVEKCPFPGLLINAKMGTSYSPNGAAEPEPMARLESTMQNIADVFIEEKGDVNATRETFITYNCRHKTISTAKKAYLPGKPLQETPENCFYERMAASRELLGEICRFSLPPQETIEDHLSKGPSFVFLYHPALGPLYSLIGEKVHGGRISSGSELELEIADLQMTDLDLAGSLRIIAEQPMGHFDEKGHLRFSPNRGRCVFKNVKVENQGVDWAASKPLWKGKYARVESLEIVLKGRSEFKAENVVFRGNQRFVVEDGMRLVAIESENGLKLQEEALES